MVNSMSKGRKCGKGEEGEENVLKKARLGMAFFFESGSTHSAAQMIVRGAYGGFCTIY